MSSLLFYFETKTPDSVNYKGFSEVGRFVIPKQLEAGSMDVFYNGKIYNSKLISDGSFCAKGYFIKNPERDILRNILFNFISQRVSNICITGNLGKYIYDDKKSIILNKIPLDVEIKDFLKFFNNDIFNNDFFLRIRDR